MKAILILMLVVLFTPSWGWAKKKVQKVNFDETSIDGIARTPDGAYLNQKRGVKFLPLYKVRKNFKKGVKESVGYLK